MARVVDAARYRRAAERCLGWAKLAKNAEEAAGLRDLADQYVNLAALALSVPPPKKGLEVENIWAPPRGALSTATTPRQYHGAGRAVRDADE